MILCASTLLTLVLLIPDAGAEPASEPFTLDQALEMAERNNPQLRVAAASIEGARAGMVTARAYPNPEVGVLPGRQMARLPGAYPGAAEVYSFAQPVETRKVRESRLRVASVARETSELVLDEARLIVRGAVKQAFYQVLRRKSEIELARENLRLVEDLRRRVQAQVNAGEVARLELVRAEAEVASARTAATSAQLRLVNAISALRAAVSQPLSADLNPVGALAPPVVLPTLDSLRDEVLNSYPSIAIARSEIRRAEARVGAETALRTPQPVVRGEYERQPDVGTYRIGVSLPVPLWNRREGPIAEAAAVLKQAQSVLEVRRIEVVAALEAAYGRYELAGQQVAAFETGVLPEAEAALKAAEAAYQFGERGIIEVLDAQRLLRAARADHLSAQFDRQAALIELEQLRAIGANKPKP